MKLLRLSALAASLLVLAPVASADEPAAERPTLLASHVTFGGAEETLLGTLPIHPEDLEAALPPPPQKVTLENSYAPVIFSHAGHLSRRTACKACHGPGPVGKIGRFQPKQAHDACRNCHIQVTRGPTDCTGCHHKKAPPATELAASGPGGRGRPSAGATSEAAVVPAAFDSAAANASFASAAAWPETGGEQVLAASRSVLEPPSFRARRSVYGGMSMLAGNGTSTTGGVAVNVTFRQEGYQFTQSFEFAGHGNNVRALGLLGGGVVWPLHERWSAHLLAVGGFDAANASWTTLLPALGARAGVEWRVPRPLVPTFDVSLTAVADVARAHDPRGRSTGGGVLSICFSAGMDLGARR